VAKESGCFDRIIVSTDDPEIAEVSRAYDAEAPFVRPPALSDDHCGTVPVIAHAVRWLMNQGTPPIDVCCIYATAPFLRAEDLLEGLEILHETGADYAFSVTSYAFPIQRAMRITPERRVALFQPQHSTTRSQDLEEAWHDAGQFYWGRAAAWLDGIPLLAEGSAPIALPRHRVQDIDTQEDWDRAELMFQAECRSEHETSE
jgi:N-acylneuraminate cytidylyltransferase